MADEMDPCLWKLKKKKKIDEQESESDDEKYGFGAKYRTGNSIKSKDQTTNDSYGKTDTILVHAQDKIQQDPGIFPYYYHREPIRGSAIFVVNQSFQHFKYRKGAEKDLTYFKSVFLDKLGFEQLNKGDDFDLKWLKLDDVLRKATSKDYSDTDFFLFAISTHGEERPKGAEHFEHALICADDQYKFTMDIIDSFSRCPTLAGKPKIFVIQACRSPYGSNENDPKIVDKGLEFNLVYKKEERDSKPKGYDSVDADNKADANNEVDLKNEANAKDKVDAKTDAKDETYAKADEKDKANAKNDTEANTKDEADAGHKSDDYQKGRSDSGFRSKTVISLDNRQKDCLVMYAIQSGKVAWRHPESGSWLLDALNEVMKEYTYPRQIPFLDTLTKTAFKMAQRQSSEGFKAVPVIQHRLTKELLIPLKNQQT